jgi:hypothetical protein
MESDRFKKFVLPFLFLVIIFISVAIVWQVIPREEELINKPKLTNEINKAVKLSASYSRISFFHTQEVRGSLAIPEHWEGKYRMIDKDKSVYFYYIGEADKEHLLFTIILYNQTDWEEINASSESKEVIGQHNNYVFVYLPAVTSKDEAYDQDFKLLFEESKNVVKSIKIN